MLTVPSKGWCHAFLLWHHRGSFGSWFEICSHQNDHRSQTLFHLSIIHVTSFLSLVLDKAYLPILCNWPKVILQALWYSFLDITIALSKNRKNQNS
jgi:hypothetical protein